MIVPYPSGTRTDYADVNAPGISHNADLPLLAGAARSCSNRCGPLGVCYQSKTSCVQDVDCPGCADPRTQKLYGPTRASRALQADVRAYDDGGKLSPGLGLQYSALTSAPAWSPDTGEFAEAYPGARFNEASVPYGLRNEAWRKAFDAELGEFRRRQRDQVKYSTGAGDLAGSGGDSSVGLSYAEKTQFQPRYPLRLSATGFFHDDMPPPANTPTNM